MNVTTSLVTQLKITEVPNLDPIDVMLENYEPGKGRITIRCYTRVWTSYWGAMSGRTVQDFFAGCDNGYLISNLAPGLSHEISDGEIITEHIRKKVIQMRKEGDLDASEAREIYDDCYCIDGPGDLQHWEHTKVMFGDEWWYADLPTRPNPEYVYLCRILDAVREGIRITATQAA